MLVDQYRVKGHHWLLGQHRVVPQYMVMGHHLECFWMDRRNREVGQHILVCHHSLSDQNRVKEHHKRLVKQKYPVQQMVVGQAAQSSKATISGGAAQTGVASQGGGGAHGGLVLRVQLEVVLAQCA